MYPIYEIDTWLDLTPLTTWNKSSGNWGAAKNHAILVIKTPNNEADLYNWSYKVKTWKYKTKGFKPDAFARPSSLECILEKDFSAKIPFIIPQTNSFYVEKRKIKILPEYFPQQEEYIFNSVIPGYENRKNIKAIKFLASIPDFHNTRQIFTKLLNIYNFSTNISIYPLINKEDLENIYTINQLAKNNKIESQYKLNKIVFIRSSLRLYYQKEILYFQKKNSVTTTMISCYPDLPARLNCQHYFIHGNFVFSFKHREKDLKNWHELQNRLIDKVEFWQRSP